MPRMDTLEQDARRPRRWATDIVSGQSATYEGDLRGPRTSVAMLLAVGGEAAS
ncbi:hypothetical protein M434DRAFT_396635, partial [Hypoxylon sp. CO27-5]